MMSDKAVTIIGIMQIAVHVRFYYFNLCAHKYRLISATVTSELCAYFLFKQSSESEHAILAVSFFVWASTYKSPPCLGLFGSTE